MLNALRQQYGYEKGTELGIRAGKDEKEEIEEKPLWGDDLDNIKLDDIESIIDSLSDRLKEGKLKKEERKNVDRFITEVVLKLAEDVKDKDNNIFDE